MNKYYIVGKKYHGIKMLFYMFIFCVYVVSYYYIHGYQYYLIKFEPNKFENTC